MSSEDQKPAEKKPQFVQRPMKLFNTLSQRKEPYPLWLLTEYVTRWTVNWYDHEDVLLSDDEFCHGRRKPNGERYDGGMPIKRTAAREYLAYAIEHYYLEARDVGDPLKRKAWRLHPQFHPKTCSLYEQVEEEEGYITAKEGEPVRVANRTYSPDEQIPMRDANRGYSPTAQVPSDEASQEAARCDPIETSYRDRFNASIKTLAPDEKIEEEQEEQPDLMALRVEYTTLSHQLAQLDANKQAGQWARLYRQVQAAEERVRQAEQTSPSPVLSPEIAKQAEGHSSEEKTAPSASESAEADERQERLRVVAGELLYWKGGLKVLKQARLPKWRGYFQWQIEAQIEALQAAYARLRAEAAKPDE